MSWLQLKLQFSCHQVNICMVLSVIYLPFFHNYTGTYCEADTDLVWSIEWEKTSAGVTAEADCPQLNQDQMVSGKKSLHGD